MQPYRTVSSGNRRPYLSIRLLFNHRVKTIFEPIRQYLDLQELNREIIEELIDRIEVGERTVIDAQRHQDIKIYYRFVGLV